MADEMREQVFSELPDGIRTMLDCDADTIVLCGTAAASFLKAAGAEPLHQGEELLGCLAAKSDRFRLTSGVIIEGWAIGRVWLRRYTPPPLSKE